MSEEHISKYVKQIWPDAFPKEVRKLDGDKISYEFFSLTGERYPMDSSGLLSEGWYQYDTSQDAWYFGCWVNPELLAVLTYAEGDITWLQCPDADAYQGQLKAMGEFYENGRIDDSDGLHWETLMAIAAPDEDDEDSVTFMINIPDLMRNTGDENDPDT